MRVNQKTYRDTILNSSGVHGIHREKIESLLLQLPEVETLTENQYEYIGPVILNVYKLSAGLVEGRCHWLHTDYYNDGSRNKEVYNLIKVEDLLSRIDDYIIKFVPVAETYLKGIDIQAELIHLFCYDYVMNLISKVQIKYEKI